ncbi:hypothetical protein HMPREF9399_0180 [Campylobacter coli JV20]|nr:hypothetical protein HMPREF9399_0180 [Campylobacter coli JV20]
MPFFLSNYPLLNPFNIPLFLNIIFLDYSLFFIFYETFKREILFFKVKFQVF